MLAQVSLIPTESKKLIAKAITQMEPVQRALREGIIVMHPSSSTYFIVEEITGRKPPTNFWVAGVIVPRGACGEMGTMVGEHALFNKATEGAAASSPRGPGWFPHSWVIRKGKWARRETLSALLEEMGPNDVYIKGVNALDTEGTVGVLWGNVVEGGTAAFVKATQARRGFHVIFPVGLEKLVPFPINDVAKEAKKFEYDYAMGVPCGLLPWQGIVVTELKAIEILSGATSIPISAGGLGGAEGAITLVIKGNAEQVTKAIQVVEASKGAKLPEVRLPNCHECPKAASFCKFPLKDKPWV